jgi:hypothetical protein
MTNLNEATSSECTCFISALRASEQLHQLLARIETHQPDQVLASTRQAINVVRQYSNCTICTDSSRFPFYSILLRQATECFPVLLQWGDSVQRESNKVKLQVGTFSVDAPIDTTIRTVVFSELQRTAGAISELGNVLETGGVKSAKETWGDTTCAYQSSLVETLKGDISRMRNDSREANR